MFIKTGRPTAGNAGDRRVYTRFALYKKLDDGWTVICGRYRQEEVYLVGVGCYGTHFHGWRNMTTWRLLPEATLWYRWKAWWNERV